MSDEQKRQPIQIIYQQMAVVSSYMMQLSPPLQKQVAEVIEDMAAALGNLQLIYEEMQTSLEASDVVESGLLEQNQSAIAERQHYYDLFQLSPDAYLVTDANGLILDGNCAIAQLLKIPQSYLPGKPLAAFVAQGDRSCFRTLLNQLSLASNVLNWEICLCPRQGEPFAAKLKVAIARDDSGSIEALRIGVHDISEYKQVVTQPAALNYEDMPAGVTTFPTSLPPALDGLQVLVVDDEADAREFITAVLESHGVYVRAVATAAAALEALEQFHPNVLISDIQMPHEDGYSLIRKVRELEAKTGWHIPAAALTAYLAEDRSKALAAGFESHLHKLAQPAELIEMVTRLSGRATT
jgi:PAS domain S-box-containing protein